MKRFHEQLKSKELPRTLNSIEHNIFLILFKINFKLLIAINPNMRFGDLVLVETDPETGELIPNSEKDPTKWGDWQHNGRVTDF